MHLPLLHISSRQPEQPPLDDPFGIGQFEGTDFIPWLADPVTAIRRAEKRTPLLDAGALFCAALGSEFSYFALMGMMFSAHDRRTANTLSAVILPSVFINQLVKARFRFPRPPQAARHDLAFVAPGDFTFPSGHAQNAVALGLFLAMRTPNTWLQATGLAVATSIPLSRVYLGVHYPRDIIAGALLGIGTLAGVKVYEQRFQHWWDNSPRGPRSATLALALSILGVVTGTPLAAFPLGVAGGLAVGHDMSGQKRFVIDSPKGKRRIIQGATGLVVTFGVGFSIRPLVKRDSAVAALLAGALVGVGQTYGIPLLNDFAKRFAILRQRRKRQRRRRVRR